jgi:hypothetical protein
MAGFGFPAHHWQQVEAGKPITVTTLLRICEVFDISMANVVRGLDAGVYEMQASSALKRRFPIAAKHLVQSAPQESFTGAHEDLPRLP